MVAVNVAKAKRTNFSHALEAKVKKIMKNPAMPQSTGGGSASLKTMTLIAEGADISRRSRSYVYQRVERKAPWEPRSFTDDNAFHQFIVTRYGRGRGVGRGLGEGLLNLLGVGLGQGRLT